MREINNNTTNMANINFQGGVQPASKETPEKVADANETKQATDLNKMPSDMIGRSQVAKSSLESDVKFFLDNPGTVERVDRMFDFLINQRGYSYEQATEIVNGAITEFRL